MKDHPLPAPSSPDDRWIDAALREHARLGNGHDDELVMRILCETVHRPARTAPPRALDWRGAAALVAGVAALAALALVVLSALPTGNPPGAGGVSDELRFAIRVDAAAAGDQAIGNADTPRVSATRHRMDLEAIPGSSEAGTALPVAQLESAAGPVLADAGILPENVRLESMRIRAGRNESQGGGLAYSDGVVVEHESFRFEADSVQLPNGEDGSASALLAEKVRLVQSTPRRIVEADSLRYDPVEGSFELVGVSRFESEKGILSGFAPGDRLRLRGDEFTIESASAADHAPPLP